MDEPRFASLRELETRLGHQFNDLEWLDQALTHKSYIHQTNVTNKESSEVLEFLGDAVLNLIVSYLLYRTFPQAHEGILSMRRAHLVKRSSLAHLSKEIRLEEYLLLGKSELIDGGRKKASILANAYEALIGAIYMDSGFDQTLNRKLPAAPLLHTNQRPLVCLHAPLHCLISVVGAGSAWQRKQAQDNKAGRDSRHLKLHVRTPP